VTKIGEGYYIKRTEEEGGGGVLGVEIGKGELKNYIHTQRGVGEED